MPARLLTWLCFVCAACCFVACSQQSQEPPRAVRVSVCDNELPRVHRIVAQFGLRFDAPESRFKVVKGFTDMPPETNYTVLLNKSVGARLGILGPLNPGFRDLESTYPTFSKSVGQRTMRDSNGRNFGTDRWGYLPSGERWRLLKFSTGNQVGYEPLPAKDADRLDEIIGTACFARDEERKY